MISEEHDNLILFETLHPVKLGHVMHFDWSFGGEDFRDQ